MTKGKFEPEAPYVVLKNGKRIEGEKVTKKEGTLFTKGKITVNGIVYKPKEVAMYSDGESTYANIGKNMFAEKYYGDSIKVFRYSETVYSAPSMGPGGSGMTGGGPHNRVRDYIQVGNTMAFKSFRYKTLKKMIPTGAPAYQYVKQYKQSKIITKSMVWGGVVMLFGGAIMGFNQLEKEKSPAVGFTIAGIGGLAFLSSPIVAFFNHNNLYKAVNSYNEYGYVGKVRKQKR